MEEENGFKRLEIPNTGEAHLFREWVENRISLFGTVKSYAKESVAPGLSLEMKRYFRALQFEIRTAKLEAAKHIHKVGETVRNRTNSNPLTPQEIIDLRAHCMSADNAIDGAVAVSTKIRDVLRDKPLVPPEIQAPARRPKQETINGKALSATFGRLKLRINFLRESLSKMSGDPLRSSIWPKIDELTVAHFGEITDIADELEDTITGGWTRESAERLSLLDVLVENMAREISDIKKLDWKFGDNQKLV